MSSLEQIAEMLQRRPPEGRFREQLFWLVDLVYACKASADDELASAARPIEAALGALGESLEGGDTETLQRISLQVDGFARLVKEKTKTGAPTDG